jgi:predicted DNA-binding transcriptional regulator YafY
MHYRRGADDGLVVERVMDPLGLVLKGGVWYLVGRAEAEFRTYRVSRIIDLELLAEGFTRPDDFELAGYWERSVAAYEASLPSFEAVVRIRAEAIWKLEQALGVATARAAVMVAGEADESGWLTLTLVLEDIWHAEAQILSLGADAEVVFPAELRGRIAATAGEMAGRYGRGHPADAFPPTEASAR